MKWVAYSIFTLLLPLGEYTLAQTATGALHGVVVDATGARVAAAHVEARAEASLAPRSTACDDRGEFRIDALPPQTYQLVVQSAGFAAATATVTVRVGTLRELTVRLNPSSQREAVVVRGGALSITAAPIDPVSQVHVGVIARGDLETFPLAQRSFANIAYFAPGTEPVEPSDPTKARITAVSTGGSSGLNNELSVDGLDDSDDYIGGFLENFSPGTIQEFAVRTAQEDADTGGTTAGSVVIVTRRGTDTWHADATAYERAAALNARYALENPAPQPKQPYSRQDYEANAGGPLRKQSLWLFGSLQATRENASIAYGAADLNQFQALAALASEGLIPGVSAIPIPSSVPVPFRDFMSSVRADWAQSPRSSWFTRLSEDRYQTRNNLVQQGTLPSTGLLTRNHYANVALANEFLFSPSWIGRLTLGAGGLRLSQTRNSNLGFALAFPFSATALTVSGFETFGDNQFATPITYFPSQRAQEKYQLRYDLTHELGHHVFKAGVNFQHEPVLGGTFSDNTETLYQFPQNPADYLSSPAQFAADMAAGASTSTLGGPFSQNVQRLAVYAQDAWRAASSLTLNYGLRYSATFGLLNASGRDQADNPAWLTLRALAIPLVPRAPGDDQHQFGPRLGFAYSPGQHTRSVIRGGAGFYFDDLAQNGWATAFQAVHSPAAVCIDPAQNPGDPQNSGCIPGHNRGGAGNVIAPGYKTPYAIHLTAGFERTLSAGSALSVDYTHEQGNHGYRAWSYTGGVNLFTPLLSRTDPAQSDVVPDLNVFHADNRSSYDALMFHFEGNAGARLNLVANYTFAYARTWGCVLGELFDYVNGVCDPLHPFAPGDYGPSGEDVRHRGVVAALAHLPGGFDLSTLTQAESARPFTITTADGSGRISINGHPTALDAFRGSPYVQMDLRVARPIHAGEHWKIIPFVEFFNLFNRVNAGANYVTDIASLPVPAAEAQSGNVTDLCANTGCTTTRPLASASQLAVPAGALGDFFGPGTTVGAPFAAQLGLRLQF